MVRTTIGFVALLAVTTAGWAEDKPKSPPSTPKEKYEALLKEYQTAQDAFFKAYQAAQTDAEKQKIFEAKYPKQEKYVGKFLELAKKNPKEAFAVDALVWVMNNSMGASKEKKNARTEALNLLRNEYLKSDKLGAALATLAYDHDKTTETFLRLVLAKSPHRDVQGQACLTLAKYLHNRTGWARRLKENPKAAKLFEGFLSKEGVQDLLKTDSDKLAKESERLFERVSEKYGDVKHPRRGTLGEVARAQLFEDRHLVIGKVAPEISGEDQDGKQFKLSDYRGKVVVLDFWGNW
jgi:AhpC/TSA family